VGKSVPTGYTRAKPWEETYDEATNAKVAAD
jgi:hypothetical protein